MLTVQDFGELHTRWGQFLSRYEAGKSDVEAQIRTIRESVKGKEEPLSDGLLSRLKNKVGRGVELVKARKQVWDLERRLSSLKGEVGAEAARIRDQLLPIALAHSVNAEAKAELDRMPALSKNLNELRRTVAAVIQDLERAAKAQDVAYSVKDAASTWQAKDAADKAGSSLRRLVVQLMQPPPRLGGGVWNQIGFDEFTSLNNYTFAANRVGEG